MNRLKYKQTNKQTKNPKAKNKQTKKQAASQHLWHVSGVCNSIMDVYTQMTKSR